MSPGLPGPTLALGLLALLLPGTRSDCGPLPKLNHAIPSDMDRIEGFPVDTQVTYRCRDGFVKIPRKSDTVVCLSNSQWSNINEFCGRSCGAPTMLKFAALSKEDESKNYHPVGVTVRYTCRPGYENITEMLVVRTCLENLTWSEAPEFCRRKSCGHPGELLHGRAVRITEFLYGAKIDFLCEDGYKLIGRPFIQCRLKGDEVEWSELPTCQGSCGAPTSLNFAVLSKEDERKNYYPAGITVRYTCRPGYENITEMLLVSTCLENLTWSEAPEFCRMITCSSPPYIANGTYDGRSVENFAYNSTVTYSCDRGFRLIGAASIHCTTKDKTSGIWSGPAPECKDTTAHVLLIGHKTSDTFSVITCSSPPYIANGTYDGRDVENFAYNSTVTYSCDRGFRLIGAASIHCTTKDKTSGIWSGPAPKCKGSYTASNNMVLEQHKKKKIKSRPYYVSQFQNQHFTITSSRSSSFPRGDLRTRGSWITPPLFRFAVPLYINQNYCSVRTKERSICRQSYMGISGVLPSATCFQNLKWSEVPGFCGNSCYP